VLQSANGRDAILNLTARHNRAYSAATARLGWPHSGTQVQLCPDHELFTDLRAAFDGGDGNVW